MWYTKKKKKNLIFTISLRADQNTMQKHNSVLLLLHVLHKHHSLSSLQHILVENAGSLWDSNLWDEILISSYL